MGWVKDTFFGGAEKDAAKQQIAAGDRAMATQKEYYTQARNDIMSLFPQAYQGLQTSYQQAMDQIGAGKTSAADILKQAFNQSNQIQQSGSNAAISALLGRPQQMQLPQAMPQPVGQTVGSKNMFQTGVAPGGLRSGQIGAGMTGAQLGGSTIQPVTQPGQYSIMGGGFPSPTGATAVQKDEYGTPVFNYGGQGPQMMQTGVTGTAGMSNPNAPTMTTGQGFNAPIAQAQSLGETPQVQSNVDMSGIGLAGAEDALNAGMQGQINALQGGSQQAQGTLGQTLNSQLGALNQGYGGAASAVNNALGGQLSALNQGASGASGALQGALSGRLGALRQGYGGAEQALNQYGQQSLGAAQQGFNQGRADILNGASNASGALGSAQFQGLGRIDQSTGQAIDYLNPYSSTGSQAQQREAALSGALGGQAQQQALNEFSESPGQKFLRERQEQALLRNASATGGLRSGSTLSALQEQASGIAAQQQQQQIENMRNIAQRGQSAATQQGQFSQSGGQAGANLMGSLAQTGAGIAANAGQAAGNMAASGGQYAGNTLSNIGQGVAGLRQGLGASESGAIGDTGNNMASILNSLGINTAGAQGQAGGNLANILSGLGQAQSGAISGVGGSIANLQNQLGGNMASVFGNTANNVAGLRSQAGQQVAGQLNNQTNALSNNQLNLGQLLAGLDTGTASQLANLLTAGGTAGSQNQMNLATLLANLATGQGSNLSQIQVGQGNAQAAGTVGGAAGAREGVGTATNILGSLFSDERLKDNITPLSDGHIGLFAWTWKHIKEIPESLRGAWSIGVIAQEVQNKFPECVTEREGFLAVDYAKLSSEVANV